jgi:sugar-specific transcriptional regulator TrmB
MSQDVKNQIIESMLSLGFNKYEAHAYVTLLLDPSKTAYEISKLSEVPQSKIYETMKKLVDRGLATAKGYKPIKYIALPLESYLDQYKTEVTDAVEFLKKNINAVAKQPTIEYIVHFNTLSQFISKVEDVLSRSEKSIYLEIWAQDYHHIREALEIASKRNVRIITVLYGEVSQPIGKIYQHEMSGLEHSLQNGRWLNSLVDNSECCFGILNDNNPTGIWTQNKSIMLLSQSFISHDILIAEIYHEMRDVLDEKFGENLDAIRRHNQID